MSQRPLLLLLLAAAACRSSPAPTAEARASAEPKPSAAPGPSPAPSAPAPPVASSVAAPGPVERTKPPTVAEWKAATKVDVEGAAWLGCVAEQVREWVRISCRPSVLLAKPAGVRVTKGASPDVLTFSKVGAASLQLRFVPGTEVDALFGWYPDLAVRLAVRWAAGAPRPTQVGAFEGLPKGPVDDRRAAACACFWENVASWKASGGYDGPAERPSKTDACQGVPEGAFRYLCFLGHEDCKSLFECSVVGGPNVFVSCLPGQDYYGAFPSAQCGYSCKGDTDCPENMACSKDDRGGVCLTP